MGNVWCPCSRNNLKDKQLDDKAPMLKIGGDSNSNNDNGNKMSSSSYGSTDKNANNTSNDTEINLKTSSNNNNNNNTNNNDNDNHNKKKNKKKKTKENPNNHKKIHDNEHEDEDEESDISDLSNHEDNHHVEANDTTNMNSLPKAIPISTETITVSNAGFSPINGEYRWFLHFKKWCLFREDCSYCLDNDIEVGNVYTQLSSLRGHNASFRWNENVDSVWTISDFEGHTIYYATPQYNKTQIPNAEWISVHGSQPLPSLAVSEIHHNLLASKSSLNHSTSNFPTTIQEEVNENYEEDSPLSDIQ